MSAPAGAAPYSTYPTFTFLKASRLLKPQDL
jgi:hypothetical protein